MILPPWSSQWEDVKTDLKIRQSLKTAPQRLAVTHVGQMSTRENPPADPGVASFCFQFSNFSFSFKKLLPACFEFYTRSWKRLENT